MLILTSLFVFNLWHFNYDGSWCGPLWVHLIWDSLYFLDLYVYFLHQVRVVLSFFHRFSNSCSPSSLSSTTMLQMLVPLKLSPMLLILFSFWILFAILIGCFILPYLPNYWFSPLLHFLYCLFSVIHSSIKLLCSLFLTDSFLLPSPFFMFPITLLKLFLSSSTWL